MLGVAPSETDAEIRAAFRTLAKKFHPDRNRDDAKAEEKFKEVSSAFDIIGDADRRRKYDRGELDEQGRERAQYRQWTGPGGQSAGGQGPGAQGYGAQGPGAQGYGPQGPGGAYSGGFANKGDFDDLGDIFADLFGRGRTAGGPGAGSSGASPGAMRGRDAKYELQVEFLDAVKGLKKRVTMPDGKSLDITLPSGVEDGQTLRLRGQGEPGVSGGPAGDVYVDIRVRPHQLFERDGDDIHIEAPITLKEAVLGGKITAPTIGGEVSITVPKNSSSGAVLRLKGRGVSREGKPPGDQYVKLKIVLPEEGDAELEEFVKRWNAGADHAPRKHFAGA